MAIVLIIVGAVLVVVAFNNTHGQLATALGNDVPAFFKWGVALAAVLGLGFIPGFEKPSRWLFGLVLLVIVLAKYEKIIGGFSKFAASEGATVGTAGGSSTSSTSSGGSSLAGGLSSLASLGKSFASLASFAAVI
jgi:hypothetical protein